MINKKKLIIFVDILAFISFVFVVSTGVLMRYVLPHGSGKSIEIIGMSRHEWGALHFYITVIFLIILAMHLLLHWRFIRKIFHGKVKEAGISRLVLGLIGLLAILALAAAPFIAPQEYSEKPRGYQHNNYKN